MANGYFERGEVYWVRVDSGFGAEQGVGRPALIISNDRANNASDCVNMAWLTTQQQDRAWDILTFATGKKCWVKCNQIITTDKNRLGKMIGVLPPEDMKKVDDALEDQFDLGYADETALKEKNVEIEALRAEKKDLKTEVARLKEQLEQRDDSKILELAMWQRLYEKALNTVVDMKFSSDVAIRQSRPVEPVVKKQEPPKVTEKKPEPPVENEDDGLVDVNSATFTELKACGLSPNMVLTVIDRRPYKTLDDVKKIPGMTNIMWQILSQKICVKPVVEQKPVVVVDPVGEKMNINYVLAKELHQKTGVSLTQCYEITGYRNKHGAYQSWDDLRKAPHVSDNVIAKLQDKIEFGPLVVNSKSLSIPRKVDKNDEEYTGEKVNINTATWKEINEKTGLSATVCHFITGYRSKNGKYASVNDILKADRVTQYHLDKYGPMMEV